MPFLPCGMGALGKQTMNTITRRVPLQPLSVNRAWKGRRFKTQEYSDFRADFAKFGSGRGFAGPVLLELVFTLPPRSFPVSDVDNLIKPVLDAIVECGFLDDDRQVIRLIAEKRLGTEYGIDFTISEFTQ